MIVDAHVHVWSVDHRAYPWQPLLAHVPPPKVPAPVERLIADMDRAEVDVAILVQPSVYGFDHRYLLQCLKACPDRFTGVGLVDPSSATPRDDLLRLCGEGQCRGIRLNTIRQGDIGWLMERDRQGLFDAVEKLEISVSFHMDIDHAPIVAELARRHPSALFIIDYLGPEIHARPDTQTYLDLLAAGPNVHFKLLCVAEDAKSAYPFPDIVSFYQAVLARFGARRVMFGSDYPGAANISEYEMLVEWGKNFPGLNAQEKMDVTGGTAARLFRLA